MFIHVHVIKSLNSSNDTIMKETRRYFQHMWTAKNVNLEYSQNSYKPVRIRPSRKKKKTKNKAMKWEFHSWEKSKWPVI